jgi:hypothetical protein
MISRLNVFDLLKVLKELKMMNDQSRHEDVSNTLQNRGTGAGGANTNIKGKTFEEKTSFEPYMLENGFIRHENTLVKKDEHATITYVSQGNLKKIMKEKYEKSLFRNPDEAYIIEYTNGTKPTILILEKKAQNVAGSVDTKLLAGPLFREEYEIALNYEFSIEYAFCVSSFLQNYIQSDKEKWIIFNKLMTNHNIPILFGDDSNYFESVNSWIDQHTKNNIV